MARTTDKSKFDMLLRTVSALGDGTGESKPTITCTASSDEIDLGDDRFALSALIQMERAFPGMTIYLNHKYVVPEDVFGKCISAHLVPRDGHTDLDLTIEVDADNPRAMQVYNQVKSGIMLGVSVGCLVDDAKEIKENGHKVLEMTSIYTLEASIIGIPANRRSWVRGALKAASAHFTGDTRDLLLRLAEADEDEDEEEEPMPDNTTEEPEEELNDKSFNEAFMALGAMMRAADPKNERIWFNVADNDDDEDATDIMIYDVIGSSWFGGITAKDFVDALNEIETPRINLHINSPGGVITDAIAIKNALDTHPATVTAYIDGFAASSASFVAIGSEKIVMQPGAMMMVHEPWSGLMGDAKAFTKEAEILNKFADNIAKMYASKSGGKAEDWRAIMEEETWYTDQEAVDAGLADEVGTAGNGKSKKKVDPDGDNDAADLFHPGVFALFKNAPDGARAFFSPEATTPVAVTKDALVIVTKGIDEAEHEEVVKDAARLVVALKAMEAEVEASKVSLAEKTTALDVIEHKLADTEGALREMTDQVEFLCDLPLARKIAPEAAFKNIADRYPWLDAAIIAQLARSEQQT